MKSLLQIRDEIGAWAQKNFKPEGMRPELGVLEKIGEAAHVCLRSLQGIRGYDDADKKKADLTDALADAGIYALHFCFLKNITPPETFSFHRDVDIFGAFRMASKSCANLIGTDDSPDLQAINIHRLFNTLFTIGTLNDGIQLRKAIQDTWEKVSQRDWVKNPSDAHLQAGSETSPQESNQYLKFPQVEDVKDLQVSGLLDATGAPVDPARPGPAIGENDQEAERKV